MRNETDWNSFLGVTTHQLDILKQLLCLPYQSQIVFQFITNWFEK